MESNNKSLIISLAVVAVFLLVIILINSQSTQTDVDDSSYNNDDIVLDTEINTVLDFPNVNTTEEDRSAHYDLAVSQSVAADELNITNCEPSPLVLEVVDGSEFGIKNDGNQDITIRFDIDVFFTIPAGDTLTAEANFGFGEGLYGYGCEGVPNEGGVSGLVLVKGQ